MGIAIESFMSRKPRCIDAAAPLAEAWRLMSHHGVRHLPVLLDGRVTGLLSQRDLLRMEAQVNVDRSRDPVSDAMTLAPYLVGPTDDVEAVVTEMANRKLGSAVVVESEGVVGIFTTTDALQAFAALLRRNAGEERRASFRAAGLT